MLYNLLILNIKNKAGYKLLLYPFFCKTINRPVMLFAYQNTYGDYINISNSRGIDSRSWKSLFKLLNLENMAEVKSYINKHKN